MAYENIPVEIQQYAQWINWKYETIDGRQTKLPLRPIDGKLASVINPLDWSDFTTAVKAASFCNGIGFVFTKTDPFCGFDFDNKSNDETAAAENTKAIAFLNSYTETSPSGTGAHVIAKATLPGNGRRRGTIECYDNGRFFTFTGNVCGNAIIEERQSQSLAIWQHLSPPITVTETNAGQNATEYLTDAQVLEHAFAAKNGEKAKRLWEGDWKTDYENKSQSEADFALINILTFYSRNATQVARMFRSSGLGGREKAKRGAYLAGMVNRAFDRMPPTVTASQGFDASAYDPWDKPPVNLALTGPYLPPRALEPRIVLPPLPDNMPVIPGLVGKLMAHCWHASTYQVPEVALASALTSMSLLAGRTYRVGSAGLSLYVLLLAKTSIGKGFGYRAQQAWCNALIKRFSNPTGGQQYKARKEFLEAMIIGKFGSGPGLAQQMLHCPSTLSQYDEFVKVIKRIAHPYAQANDLAIQEEMLSLTDAANPGALYVEKAYSDRGPKRKERIRVHHACLTILGTGTPEEFYDDLNNGILEGGFLPRFTIIEYDGTLPEKNHNEIHALDPEMLDEITRHFNQLFELSRVMNGEINQIIDVPMTDDARNMLFAWERFCEQQVRIAHKMNAATAGLWSRVMVHTKQISALIAIGCNMYAPMITNEHAGIAISIVKAGLSKLCGKVETGEVGTGDVRGEAEIKRFVQRIRKEGYDFVAKFPGLSTEVSKTQYVQTSLIRWFVAKRAPFANHRNGANRAYDDAISAMIKNGDFERKEFLAISGRKIPALLPQF